MQQVGLAAQNTNRQLRVRMEFAKQAGNRHMTLDVVVTGKDGKLSQV
jgi:hypothetical protein